MTSNLPPAPESARGVFADRLPLAERYAALLATVGVERGLIGPREAPRLWERHLINSAALTALLETDTNVCDIGSGAGLPGLVLAITRPDLEVTLVEPLLRRCTFLHEVVEELSLTNVEVIRARAEVLHGERTFSVVTSRAVAPLDRLVPWSMPLVAPDGVLLAMKGSNADREIQDADPVLRKWRCASPTLHEVGGTSVVRVAWADPQRIGWRPPPNQSAAPRARRGDRRRRRGSTRS